MSVPEFIQKQNNVEWIIPRTYKVGMHVPAKIIASQNIVANMDAQVYDQITNVATLPGIINHAYCMPDGHSGYGFPIGGVAAFDLKKGVISPGGIGFDINCLHPDTKILTHYGYYKKIKDFSRDLSDDISFLEVETGKKSADKPAAFMKKNADTSVINIETETGEEIILSTDHPLFDGSMFKEAGKIRENDTIVIHPFRGVEYEEPSDEIILNEDDIKEVIGNRPKLLKELRDKDLIPLRYNSKKLPVLAKLVGFITGDGSIGSYYSKKRKMNIWSSRVIGRQEDLEEIRNDIKKLGYDANYIKTAVYNSKIIQADRKEKEICGTSTQLFIISQSLSVLLHALGVPKGNKSRNATKVPEWIKKAPLWVKRLYLAGLFGAELAKPAQRKGEKYRFIEPSFNQNKINSLERENMNFMLDIINLLLEFGVATNKIYKQKGVINRRGEETHKLSIRLSSKTENLTKLWGRIGYEYSKKRINTSMVALAYLNYKKACLKNLEEKQTITVTGMNQVNMPEIVQTRISRDFQTFDDFVSSHKIGDTPFVLDKVRKIRKTDYTGDVYDFMMNNRDHNFIANCIVSHNCGMRLIRTNLTIDDVRPRLKELVNLLFQKVPAGVGSSGFLKLTRDQFREVIVEGSRWCVEKGYGWEEDLRRTEEDGCMKGADTAAVSKKAIDRGITQIGTLGSGNHYLEIQVVKEDNIFDKHVAKEFGLFPGQIVVMFHCGSRGFGHQIGTDYLELFLDVMEKKYGIKILDKELACAPFESKEGQDYYKAMKCAVNMSFANRQVILHRVRECFSQVFKKSPEEMEMHQIYDVAHNIAKIEKHSVNNEEREVLVHRKGATRSFGPGREEIIDEYRHIGQPVIIGGSMETGSYLLLGTEKAMKETFGTTAHGSGRTMSRTRAKQLFRGDKLQRDMEQRGIYVKTVSMSGLAEEAGAAYKDVDEVIEATHTAGISKKIVKLVPIGNVKG